MRRQKRREEPKNMQHCGVGEELVQKPGFLFHRKWNSVIYISYFHFEADIYNLTWKNLLWFKKSRVFFSYFNFQNIWIYCNRKAFQMQNQNIFFLSLTSQITKVKIIFSLQNSFTETVPFLLFFCLVDKPWCLCSQVQ